jgi:hypothetical protein
MYPLAYTVDMTPHEYTEEEKESFRKWREEDSTEAQKLIAIKKIADSLDRMVPILEEISVQLSD